MPSPTPPSSRSAPLTLLCTSLLLLALVLAAKPVAAQGTYTPQVFNAATDTGQDFTTVPVNTAWNASNGINQTVWNHIFWDGGTNNPGPQFYFAGSTGLWITSSSALGWPNTGMMQEDTVCSAGFGYGDFHWRSAEGQSAAGPGSNQIMWPADGDPGWPGIIKGSSDNHIGEVDISEVNYASNDTLFSTFHYFDANASGNNGQIMNVPDTFPAGSGDMTAMHDFDAIWGPGSLVIKIDGVVQMSAPTAQVRADYAHGGCNYTLGAQMAMQATGYDKTPDNWIEIANMWWSAKDGTTQPVTNSMSISAPSGLVAGSNATLSIASNYAVSKNVTVTVGGASYTLPVSGSGTSYTVTIPGTDTVAGTYQVQVTDGATKSNAISVMFSASNPGGALQIESLTYTSSSLTLLGTVYQSVAGGIRFLIDGKYVGVLRDSSPVGTHNLTYVFPTAPSSGSHTVTYYINGEQSTTSVTGTFTAP
ncbi:hypothetical protein RBB75_13500 [Tunturibacter empetritectus]|uniref:GH16 domain-containing protein n=1 Tax=Tunturiibacter empetritectus TaxID=3069691 RepID=A0AAU7Z9P4_9BACT